MQIPNHDKATEYRRRAQEARDDAAWMSIISTREHLLETARHLEILAEAEERQAQRMDVTEAPKPEDDTRVRERGFV